MHFYPFCFLSFSDMVDIDHSMVVALDMQNPNKNWVFLSWLLMLLQRGGCDGWGHGRQGERGYKGMEGGKHGVVFVRGGGRIVMEGEEGEEGRGE